MILHGKNQQFWKESFLFSKLNECNLYWDWRIYTDHLSYLDVIKFLKHIRVEKKIFLSLESSIHSISYSRPYAYSNFNITHKDVCNSIYYNIFVEDYLNNLFKINKTELNKERKTIFISSNIQKISYVQGLFKEGFTDLAFYGSFSSTVPTDSDLGYQRNAQSLMEKYDSAICIENSLENGYIQGSFLPALLSGTVPIFHGSNSIKKNILNDGVFIDLHEYIAMSKSDRLYNISKCKDRIMTDNRLFTTLAYEYFDFCKEMNLSNISEAIKESQEFRRKIFIN
jgi:hypothetical protein